MTNQMKRLLALAVAVLLTIACLSGCSGTKDDVPGTTTTIADSIVGTTEADGTTTTAQGGVEKTTTTKKSGATIASGNDVGNAGDNIDSGNALGGSSNVAMPTRELKNKTVTIFSWRNQTDSSLMTGTKPDIPAIYKSVGLNVKTILTTHSTYNDDLAARVAAGGDQVPDLMEPNQNKFYPSAISSNLVQPIDNYFDFKSDLWKDYKSVAEQYQINGKTYFAVEYFWLSTMIYYNPKMFADAGLKTPREYWEEDNWTMDTLQYLADKLVVKNPAGDVTRLGYALFDPTAITGVELVQYSRTNGYKLNITNSKYSKLMGYLYEMGRAGTKSAGFSNATQFLAGKVAMLETPTWAHTQELDAMRKKGELEWIILPRLDSSSKHYYNVTWQPTFGIVTGAPNPDGAAYVIELRRWAFLNYPWVESIPFSGTAYTKKFGEKKTGVNLETEAEASYTKKMLSKGYDVMIPNPSYGWIGSSQFPGITQVVTNGNKWSTVVKNQSPVLEAALKTYRFS